MEKNKKEKKIDIVLMTIIGIIVIIDQVLKAIIIKFNNISILEGILNFNIYQNISGTYGIGSDSKLMYILTNVIVLAVVFKFMKTQNEFIDMKLKVFLSFIFAGGCSNVIDRIFRGYVVEFIDFKQVINMPVFNVADLFILIGWVGFAGIFAAFTVQEWNKNRSKKKKEN